MGATIKSMVTSGMILSLFLSMIVSPIHVFGLEENKLLFPKSMFPQSDAYKTGWAAGFLGQPFKGHHTRDYIFGYLNGTSTYVYNYNDTSGGHNLDWYIGFHNGAAVADDQYQKGGNFNGDGVCYGVYGKEYCDGYRAGYATDANALG
jgi:hypothetical protein